MPDSLSTTADTLPMTPLATLISMGGPVMIVLCVLAVAGLITFFYLILSAALLAPRPNRCIRQAVASWQAGRGDSALRDLDRRDGFLARCNPLHRLTRDAMAGVQHRRNPDQLRENLALGAQKALQPFEAPLKIVEVIAALAPLLGLLGTVMGMMEAFSAMAAAEGQANARELSGGIYQALTTTAAGLVIAIPFAAIAAWAEFRLRRLNTGMNELLLKILNHAPDPQETVAGDSNTAIGPRTTSADPATDSRRMVHAAG